jgi:hypothetical protein
MTRTYEYLGYTLVVAVESDSSWRQPGGAAARVMPWRYFHRCVSVRPAVTRLRQKQTP